MKIWRLIVFLLFSIVVPATYLIYRFNLFSAENTISIGIGGIIVFSILIGTIGVLIKYYLEGMKTKYSYFKQILQGLLKLIFPLAIVLLVIVFLQDNIGLIKEALFILIPSEFLAILFNPFPKWCFENNIEGISEIADKIFKKKKESE